MVDQATAQELGLAMGSPDIRSVGPLAFGPEGVLFVGDNAGASIFALDVGDVLTVGQRESLDLEDLDTSLASYMGCSREDVQIRDMAVHPPLGERLPLGNAGQRRRRGAGHSAH